MSGPHGPVRVVFAGTPEVALPALEALVADPRVEVVGVLTNPARPRGRRGTPIEPPVAVRGRELDLPVLQPGRPAEALAALAALDADVGAVVAYGALLPKSVLAATRAGWVNLHFSRLPRWRGAAPVQHAIAAGDTSLGVTVFRLDEGMDTGPVLRTAELPVPPDANAGELLDDVARLGAPILVDGAIAAAVGEPGTPQPATGVTLAPRLGPDDARIAWSEPAEVVARRILAVTPRPGATTLLRGRLLKVADPAVVAGAPAAAPGAVVAADTEGIVVACGTGAVRVARLLPEGRRWTSAAEALRGRLVAVGDVLGAPGTPDLRR